MQRLGEFHAYPLVESRAERLARHALLGASRHATPLRWLMGGYLRDGIGRR